MSNTYFCGFCEKELPADIARSRHYTQEQLQRPIPMYCNREHRALARQRDGEFKAMSVKGRSARSVAVAKSNRSNPRRRKVSHD